MKLCLTKSPSVKILMEHKDYEQGKHDSYSYFLLIFLTIPQLML